MVLRLRGRDVGGVILAAALAHAPALAATAAANGTVSTCTDCEFIIDWNPRFDCDDPFSGGDGLVDCLLASGPPGCSPDPSVGPEAVGGSQLPQHLQQIQGGGENGGGCYVTHSTGIYYVEPLENPPPYGLFITRDDESEIDRLHTFENYPEITWVELFVDQPDRIALIAMIIGEPSSGQIILRLNDRIIKVETAFANDADDVTQALKAAIRGAGFSIASVPPFLEIRWDDKLNTGIKLVSFESTDPGIVRSEIAIEPQERAENPILGEPEL